jgi:hypothetical protein
VYCGDYYDVLNMGGPHDLISEVSHFHLLFWLQFYEYCFSHNLVNLSTYDMIEAITSRSSASG